MVCSANGPYVDQSGVLLLNGGGTLILGSHGSVRSLLSSVTDC